MVAANEGLSALDAAALGTHLHDEHPNAMDWSVYSIPTVGAVPPVPPMLRGSRCAKTRAFQPLRPHTPQEDHFPRAAELRSQARLCVCTWLACVHMARVCAHGARVRAFACVVCCACRVARACRVRQGTRSRGLYCDACRLSRRTLQRKRRARWCRCTTHTGSHPCLVPRIRLETLV